MTAPARFRQADLKRIFAAAKAAGVRATIKPDGTIEMLTESDGAPQGQSKLREKVFGAQA